MDIKEGDWVTKERWGNVWYEVADVTEDEIILYLNNPRKERVSYNKNIPKDKPQWIVRKSNEVYGICTHEGKYESIGKEIGALVDEKNKAYGDSFGQAHKFLELLWPDGIPMSSYKDLLSIVRVWDKIKRIATDKDALGENPWRDIGGYSILEVGRSDGND